MKQSAASRWPRRFFLFVALVGAAGAAFVAVRTFGLIDWAAAAATEGAGEPTTKPAKKPKVDPAEQFFTTEPPIRVRVRVADRQMQALRADARTYVKATIF